MTVKDVFELRKQGKTEEAYDAIRPMYAVHKGKYTTLCMFWVGSDMLKKRLKENRGEEAVAIFEALLRVQPNIDDRDGKVHDAVVNDALKLSESVPTFSMLSFVERYGIEKLKEEDWQTPLFALSPDASAKSKRTPPTALRLLTRCFHEIMQQPSAERALQAMPLLQEAVRRNPVSKNCLRYMAVVYRILGNKEKSVEFYQLALTRYHDSYLFSELAELTDDPGERAALYCRAIENQRQEKFATGYRLELAKLLEGRDNRRAAYELKRCVDTRRALHYAITSDMLILQTKLKGVQPVDEASQRDFYRRMEQKYPLGSSYKPKD